MIVDLIDVGLCQSGNNYRDASWWVLTSTL